MHRLFTIFHDFFSIDFLSMCSSIFNRKCIPKWSHFGNTFHEKKTNSLYESGLDTATMPGDLGTSTRHIRGEPRRKSPLYRKVGWKERALRSCQFSFVTLFDIFGEFLISQILRKLSQKKFLRPAFFINNVYYLGATQNEEFSVRDMNIPHKLLLFFWKILPKAMCRGIYFEIL